MGFLQRFPFRAAAIATIAVLAGSAVLTTSAQTTVKYDVATTYGFITLETDGTVVGPYSDTNNSAVISVPAGSLFKTVPSVSANNSLQSGLITLSLQAAPSASPQPTVELTLLNVRYTRKSLLLELKPDLGTKTILSTGDQVLPLILKNTQANTQFLMNVIVRVQ